MMNIKKTLAIAAVGLAVVSGPVFGGGLAEPMMEPEVIVEESNRSGGFVIPLLLIAILVAVASGGGGGGTPNGPSDL